MNSKKIFTYALIILTGMMVAALAAYYLLTSFGYTTQQPQQAELPPVTSVLVGGMIQTISSGTDPIMFTVLTATGETKIVAVPQDRSQCPAAADMVDIQKVAVGDELAARGEVAEDGSIVPCHDATHYLKVIKMAPVQTTASSTAPVATTTDNARIAHPATSTAPVGKLKAANFTGKLDKVDTGCFSDGECFAVIDGKHVTTLRGWSQAEVGSVQGVPSFGDLEQVIGKTVEVYAQDLSDGTYTLYGSAGFYIKVLP